MRTKVMLGFVCVCAMLIAVSCGQQDGEQTAVVTTAGPTASLSDIVPAGAVLTKLTGDIPFDTSGSPCWYNGDLYFTNNNFDVPENNKTQVLHGMSHHMILREMNGVTTSIHQTGKGTFYCCEMVGHRVIEMDTNGNVVRTVAGEYNGKRLDGPNDLSLIHI